MASGKGNTFANDVLDFAVKNSGGNTSTGPVEASIKISLRDTAPTAASPGTEISGTGYSPGGTAVTFGTIATQQVQGHSGALTWTNGSGGDWTIDGYLIHDAAGDPAEAAVVYFESLAATETVPNGADFEIATNGITITEA